MKTKIGVVMPCLSEFQLAVDALASVQTKHDWTPYIIPNFRLRWILSRSWNYGVQSAIDDGCTHICVINDDVLFSPFTIDALVNTMEADPKIALASAMTLRGQVQDPYDVVGLKEWNHPESLSEHPDFSCFMLTPESFQHIGLFDENFRPAYFEDNDYHYRIKLAGRKAVSTNQAPYFHYGSRTQNSNPAQPVVPGPQFEANRAYFAEKWGGVPGQEKYVTPYGDPQLTHKDWNGQ